MSGAGMRRPEVMPLPQATEVPGPFVRSRFLKSGVAKCECGKTISGNKRFCWKCAEIKAKEAGLF